MRPAARASRSWNRASGCMPRTANSRAARSALSSGTADHVTLPSGIFVFSVFCARRRRASTRCPACRGAGANTATSRKYSGRRQCVNRSAHTAPSARARRRRRSLRAAAPSRAPPPPTRHPSPRALSDPRIDTEQHAPRTPPRRIVQPVHAEHVVQHPALHRPIHERSRRAADHRTSGPPQHLHPARPEHQHLRPHTHRRAVLLDRAVVVVREVRHVRARGEHARDLALGLARRDEPRRIDPRVEADRQRRDAEQQRRAASSAAGPRTTRDAGAAPRPTRERRGHVRRRQPPLRTGNR